VRPAMKPTIGLLAAALRFVLQELRGFFFGRSADLADHDDRLGRVVGEEQLEHVDEVGAVDRIAADADRGGLAEALVRRLEHRLIGQRARTADDADRALLENMLPGMMPILHSPASARRGSSGRSGATSMPGQRALDAHHVEHRNALGDADDQRNLGIDRLEDRVGGEWRRNVDRPTRSRRSRRRLRAPCRTRAGRCASCRPCPASRRRPSWCRRRAPARCGTCRCAGHPLADDLGILVDEDAHRRPQSLFRHPGGRPGYICLRRRP
jgi:hypothetical protein